jgi:diguanylate cyclase (GGDEF)-like protein
MTRTRSDRSDTGWISRSRRRRSVEAERLDAESDQTASEADQTASEADQTASDTDQTASDTDQTASDTDQTAAEQDEADAASDQQAAEQDQASADKHLGDDPAGLEGYEASRTAREAAKAHRLFTQVARARTSRLRLTTASGRDETADRRDETARRRDLRAADLDRFVAAADVPLADKLKLVLAHAADARDRAAADRARAAQDRANAARERARLEAELNRAHLDDLTGAFRREAGRVALSHEIDRALRADGRFVLVFVDIDSMKAVNDRDGHAAGDRVLKNVVWIMRSNLRSFDPVVRFGGDEFVCGLGGLGLDEAAGRFQTIGRSVVRQIGVTISVGMAQLEPSETLDQLTARADAALLDAKRRRSP